jgi:hypothetical protein
MSETVNVLRLAEAIAAELGDGWSAKPTDQSPRQAELHGPDGEVILATGEGRRSVDAGRLELRGWVPDRLDDFARQVYTGDLPRKPAVNASVTRSAKALAGEITRRILPDYRTHLAGLTARVESYRKAAGERDAVIAAIEALGVNVHNGRAYVGPVCFDVESGGSLNVTRTTIPGPEAVKFVEFVRTLQG